MFKLRAVGLAGTYVHRLMCLVRLFSPLANSVNCGKHQQPLLPPEVVAVDRILKEEGGSTGGWSDGDHERFLRYRTQYRGQPHVYCVKTAEVTDQHASGLCARGGGGRDSEGRAEKRSTPTHRDLKKRAFWGENGIAPRSNACLVSRLIDLDPRFD